MKRMKMSKKAGFLLLETTVKIVAAVICIVLILFVMGLIYWGFISSGQKTEQAKATLELIYYRIENIEAESEQFLVEAPGDWVIVAWPNGVLSDWPNVCERDYETSCICVCKDSSITGKVTEFSRFKNIKKNCNKEELCKDLDRRIEIVGNKIKIEGLIGVNLTLKDNNLKLEKLA